MAIMSNFHTIFTVLNSPKNSNTASPVAAQPTTLCAKSFLDRRHRTKPIDNPARYQQSHHSFRAMIASRLIPSALAGDSSTILQFPTEVIHAVRSLRNMTTQLLQEAAKVIPNQQLLINVVSKRVRQLGLGHRPLVEATPRSSLADIALKEIIAGKLTFEELKNSSDGAA
jgi:DNA-directed RNA polymerase subunit omega